MTEGKIIHFSDLSQQPDVRIFCTQEWSIPAWEYNAKPFLLENGKYYSFIFNEVTCNLCQSKSLNIK